MTMIRNLVLRWVGTLKFKIVAVMVLTGVVSALSMTQIVLTKTQTEIERLLLATAAEDSERTAGLLASKLEMLTVALSGVASQATPDKWHDSARMTRFLADKPSAIALFDSFFAATIDGAMLARIEKENTGATRVNIADREYFQQALKTDQAVVSKADVGKVSGLPIIVIAIPVLAADGQVTGVVGASLQLQSSGLFSNLSGSSRAAESRVLVMDRAGLLLSHPDAGRVLGKAADEPGLSDVFARWHDSGSPIETQGSAVLSNDHLVSMAGIPASDWVLVRLTPQSSALAPLAEARQVAWRAAIGVGLVATVLAGLLGWAITRPISALRARAERLLTDAGAASEGWPKHAGEVGELSQAFQHVVVQRQQRQGEIQALLQQLEAVLDHAEVGIALTRNGHFELVSRQFCRIFRAEKQHIIGQATRMIHASDEAYQALSARAHPAFMAHGAFDGELELVRRSGQAFWAHMRGRAVVAGDRSQGTIWIIEDVTEVREQRERLTWTSSHDALTGLSNRPAFESLLEQATAQAATAQFCALFIDLDRFKQVNDTGGHAAGDALLRDVAKALAAQTRKSDTVARLGGDEFAVLLPDCPLGPAEVIAERMRAAVVGYRLQWEGHSFGVGASIGLVRVDAGFATAADVLRAADAACYAAKSQGRNCVAVHGRAVAPDATVARQQAEPPSAVPA